MNEVSHMAAILMNFITTQIKSKRRLFILEIFTHKLTMLAHIKIFDFELYVFIMIFYYLLKRY